MRCMTHIVTEKVPNSVYAEEHEREAGLNIPEMGSGYRQAVKPITSKLLPEELIHLSDRGIQCCVHRNQKLAEPGMIPH
jgi:hypothetical protein